MNSLFPATFPSWYLLKILYKYIYARRGRCKREYLLYVEACIFGKASLVFGQTVFWNQMGILYQNWKFPDCRHFFGTRDRQAVIETITVVYENTKRTQEMCSPIRHNNTKHFLCPIRSRHPLEFLEMVRWESVPRGSFALTWKLSSRLFSRPDWLPLGLRGCNYVWMEAFCTLFWRGCRRGSRVV